MLILTLVGREQTGSESVFVGSSLTLSPEAMDPSKHFDPLTSLGLQMMDFYLRVKKNVSKTPDDRSVDFRIRITLLSF